MLVCIFYKVMQRQKKKVEHDKGQSEGQTCIAITVMKLLKWIIKTFISSLSVY
jgi:hypothetical protein